MDLKPLLKSVTTYKGVDLEPGEDIIVSDLEKGLENFEDNAFDIVVALDVIEHVERCHLLIKEVLRVAKKAAFISLPNMHYIQFRLNFLLGKGISGKYLFPPHPIRDRHRWLLSYSESVEFVKQNSKWHRVQTQIIVPQRGRTKAIAGPIERILGEKWPNLFAYGSLFMITPEQGDGS